MEQTLGHVTHFQNLKAAVGRQSSIEASWLPIEFGLSRFERIVPTYRSNWSVRAGLRARHQLSIELARHDLQAMFFHSQVTALFSTGLMRRIPSVVSLDATPLNYDAVGAAYGHRPAGEGWLDEKKRRMNRDVFHAAHAVVAWSDWARGSLVADYGVPRERITVLAPGASAAYFQIGAERMPAVAEATPVRLLFVGGDFERKGGPLLLESVAAARTQRAFELHVVTQWPVAPRPNVFVHNGIGPNSPELLRLFREADAFVLPSRGECLSLVLMEAAAAGLPILSSDVGGLREAAIAGENAVVVGANDAAGLRSGLERLVDDPSLRRRLGQASHSIARQKFDAGHNNQEILDLICDAADAGRSRKVA